MRTCICRPCKLKSTCIKSQIKSKVRQHCGCYADNVSYLLSPSFAAILPTLRAQHALSLALASKLAAMHDDLEEMKQVYAYLWRQRGSFSALRDPFVEAGLTDSATAYPSTTSNQLKSLQL